MMVDVDTLKDTISGIRSEYMKDNGYDGGVDHVVSEIMDAIGNIVYLSGGDILEGGVK